MIKILQRRQIDDRRWNELISSSPYETIYPYTWYLDACADKWLAFVMNDYECAMPVVFRSKMGVKYCYQPVYCQQLGVYSALRVDTEIARMFLHEMKKYFRIGDYSFNEGNILGEEKGYEVSDSLNYVLPLKESYEFIQKNYNENCRRNIKKAFRNDLEFTEKISLDEIISLKRSGDKLDRKDEHYAYVKNLFSKLQSENKIKIFGALSGKHLMAAAVFAYSSSRAIFLLSASSERGKEQSAMFLVVDSFIQMHAGENIKLDFEGSNISSVARFFRGFGAKPELYQRASFNNTASKIIKKLKSV